MFAGAVQRRKVNLLGHEYETLLPDPRGRAARRIPSRTYAGPESVFSRTHLQLEKQGYIRIGDNVPDFTAETSFLGPLSFYEFVGDAWCGRFLHPVDFTPVCTTELGATARLEAEWRKRGVKVVGLSVDSTADHEQWIADINATQGAEVNFPIIADKDREVAMLFGMLDATHFRHGTNLRKRPKLSAMCSSYRPPGGWS